MFLSDSWAWTTTRCYLHCTQPATNKCVYCDRAGDSDCCTVPWGCAIYTSSSKWSISYFGGWSKLLWDVAMKKGSSKLQTFWMEQHCFTPPSMHWFCMRVFFWLIVNECFRWMHAWGKISSSGSYDSKNGRFLKHSGCWDEEHALNEA